MKDTTSVDIQVGDKKITIESGLLAGQAEGAVTVQMGDTILFCAVTTSKTPRKGVDYFPLQIEYREKFYAAGRFPGGFFKREARPSEKEILTSRFTDRPIRPLFPDGTRNDVQVNSMLLSADGENEPDMLNIIAASAALVISELPFYGPIGGVRIGRIDGNFVVNPTHAEQEKSDLDLIYTSNREFPVMMEGGAKEVSESDLLEAMRFAHAECLKIIDAQLELRKKLGLPDKELPAETTDDTILPALNAAFGAPLAEALQNTDKRERNEAVHQVRAQAEEKLLEQFPDMADDAFATAFENAEIKEIRRLALDEGRRLDGRAFDDLRPLNAQVGLLPRAHGSALFSRGDTQALGTLTLGTSSDAQSMDAISGGPDEKKFMMHYNFPPYSVGEAGRIMGPGRREIGHGALAERCLREVLPEDYPYTIRLVSDIMSSNGSSSMASVCTGCLALMDAGVPITKPVAGISIGLVTGEDKACLVTDIIGDEDHAGDMDFKVAGTRDGITGFQFDLKIRGLPWDLAEQAFTKAREARIKILDFMQSVIEAPRPELSPYAPRIHVMKINPDKIGAVIGPGGKIIRRITDTTGAKIDIEDDGTVSIFSASKDGMDAAVREVEALTASAEEGRIYEGTVKGVKDFGAFVEILPGQEGLVHISELADFRVGAVEDICKLGDTMKVKCIGIDGDRIRLSRRAAMAELDEK